MSIQAFTFQCNHAKLAKPPQAPGRHERYGLPSLEHARFINQLTTISYLLLPGNDSYIIAVKLCTTIPAMILQFNSIQTIIVIVLVNP